MSAKPEALRLADAIDSRDIVSESDVAAELRRLCQSEREGWRYADELEQERKRLHEENQRLKTVMIAAAEELAKHWEAHCDAEGYGPVNLLRRLEKGIAAEYGYTAGSFARLHEVNQELLEALESLLEMTGKPPDWNCTCHLTPPCIDCVDYSGWRNAFKFATSVLAKATGEQP